MLNLINILLHSLGFKLLRDIHNHHRQKHIHNMQRLYIMNLSVCEILINTLIFFYSLFLLVPFSDTQSEVVSKIAEYINIVYLSGACTVYFITMCFIIIDKLLEIALHLRYQLTCSLHNTYYVLVVIWLFGGIITLVSVLVRSLTEFDILRLYFTYYYPSFHCGFIILSITTYSYIFYHFKATRERPSLKRKESGTSQSSKTVRQNRPILRPANSCSVFWNSRFYISALLMMTYIVFVTVPDFTFLIYGYYWHHDQDQIFVLGCYISYMFATTTDACVYIFLQKSVRNLLKKYVRRNRYAGNISQTRRKSALTAFLTTQPHSNTSRESSFVRDV